MWNCSVEWAIGTSSLLAANKMNVPGKRQLFPCYMERYWLQVLVAANSQGRTILFVFLENDVVQVTGFNLFIVWGQIWIKYSETPARVVLFSTYLGEGRGWCHQECCCIKSWCCKWQLAIRFYSCQHLLNQTYSLEDCQKLLSRCFITLSQSSTPPWLLKQENFPHSLLVQRASLL